MTKLFISYSRENQATVQGIVQDLRDLGFGVWIDTTGITAGKQFSEEIATAITDCDFFLLFISSSSVQSEGVRREVDIAHEKEKTIIPVRLEQVDIPTKLKYQLIGIQWIEHENPKWFFQLLVAVGASTKIDNHLVEEPHPPSRQAVETTTKKEDQIDSVKHKTIEAEIAPTLQSSEVKLSRTPNESLEFLGSTKKSLKSYYDDFLAKKDYLDNFQERINQITNPRISMMAQGEFGNLVELVNSLAKEMVEHPLDDLKRISELAGIIANLIKSVAGLVAVRESPTLYLNQISQHLPLLRHLVRQVLLWLERVGNSND